jgi:hypothetical protein
MEKKTSYTVEEKPDINPYTKHVTKKLSVLALATGSLVWNLRRKAPGFYLRHGLSRMENTL